MESIFNKLSMNNVQYNEDMSLLANFKIKSNTVINELWYDCSEESLYNIINELVINIEKTMKVEAYNFNDEENKQRKKNFTRLRELHWLINEQFPNKISETIYNRLHKLLNDACIVINRIRTKNKFRSHDLLLQELLCSDIWAHNQIHSHLLYTLEYIETLSSAQQQKIFTSYYGNNCWSLLNYYFFQYKDAKASVYSMKILRKIVTLITKECTIESLDSIFHIENISPALLPYSDYCISRFFDVIKDIMENFIKIRNKKINKDELSSLFPCYEDWITSVQQELIKLKKVTKSPSIHTKKIVHFE